MTDTPAAVTAGKDRRNVLVELKTLIDSFPQAVRRQLLAELHTLFTGLTS